MMGREPMQQGSTKETVIPKTTAKQMKTKNIVQAVTLLAIVAVSSGLLFAAGGPGDHWKISSYAGSSPATR
jgi:hypothetical protein